MLIPNTTADRAITNSKDQRVVNLTRFESRYIKHLHL